MNYEECFVSTFSRLRFGADNLFGVEENEIVCQVKAGRGSLAQVYAYAFPKSVDKADFEKWVATRFRETRLAFIWV